MKRDEDTQAGAGAAEEIPQAVAVATVAETPQGTATATTPEMPQGLAAATAPEMPQGTAAAVPEGAPGETPQAGLAADDTPPGGPVAAPEQAGADG